MTMQVKMDGKGRVKNGRAITTKTKNVADGKKKRKSGIPTGNAGEYFVMGELLRRGFDAQLADRNTKGYDLLVGTERDPRLRKVQVKTVRSQPWYVRQANFIGEQKRQVTVYVLLGAEDGAKPVRYFIARNRALAKRVHVPNSGWQENAFINIKWLRAYEGKWETLGSVRGGTSRRRFG